ncbi:hypothetical protein ACH4VR_29625 [Streptomyces sp. NPDC020883]|uniref:hypothetical protein n=1 Tax=Streptomyces sp. NPDC020883 TaxID=3365099 RepID=UPI003788C47A
MTNPNPAPDPAPDAVPATQVGYGVRAARSGFLLPHPALDTAALIESIRVQLRTWVVSAYGVRVPEPGVLVTTADLSVFISRVTLAAKESGVCQDGAVGWGMAQLFHAEVDALRAAQGGDSRAYLLGTLYSLIGARAGLLNGDDYPTTLALSPFPGHVPALNEASLIETIRAQVLIFLKTPGVYMPQRWQMRDAADLSGFIAEVAQAAEALYGDMDDDDSIRGLGHLINARAHALKAAYNHGNRYLFAALDSLILAVANLDSL